MGCDLGIKGRSPFTGLNIEPSFHEQILARPSSKDRGPEDPTLVQPLEGGRFVTDLISAFYWSIGVLEYWTTEHTTNIYQE